MPHRSTALAKPEVVRAAPDGQGSRGFIGTVGRVAVVVGCLSGIVGLLTSAGPLVERARAWRSTPPSPRTTLSPGGVLGVSWSSAARRLAFAYNADLLNEGNAPDRFLSARAYLLDPLADAAHPGVQATLAAIEMTENDHEVRFPLNLGAGQTLPLRLLVAPETVDLAEPFGRVGVYRLVLELEKRGGPSRGTYCFFMGRQTLAQLHAQGFLNVSPYLECQES